MKLYSLELYPEGDLDDKTKFIDRLSHPPKVTNVGLILNNWPFDDFATAYDVTYVSGRLRSILLYNKIEGIKFTKIDRITNGPDFDRNYHNAELTPFWRAEFTNEVGKYPITIYKELYLVVNERARTILRENFVRNAKYDEITMSVEEYFSVLLPK